MVDPGSGAVSETPVVVASRDGDSAWLASGVTEGAQIVALGAHKIDAHDKVRVVQTLAGL